MFLCDAVCQSSYEIQLGVLYEAGTAGALRNMAATRQCRPWGEIKTCKQCFNPFGVPLKYTRYDSSIYKSFAMNVFYARPFLHYMSSSEFKFQCLGFIEGSANAP